MVSDGLHGYDYDDADQLIGVTVTNLSKSVFVYDGFGRRRIRREYAWVTNSSSWQQTSETRYVYDGMLVLQERDQNGTPQVTYTRGLDLSGGPPGRWGHRRSLARTDGSGSAYYHADGAGNITAMVNSQGNLVAKYLYDPFGNTLGKWGSLADANLIRFSSKEVQIPSGLYLYGFRFYDPNLQRWPNQDPIQRGGLNLYGYVGNNSINGIDPLGLWNLWNPATWGVANGAGWSSWNSLTPWHASAGWAGFSLQTTSEADAAFIDGINPFGNPFANMGLYDSSDKALKWSRCIGTLTRDAELILAVPNIGSWAKNPFLYEVGSTTVPTEVYEAMNGLNAVAKGDYLLSNYGLRGILQLNYEALRLGNLQTQSAPE